MKRFNFILASVLILLAASSIFAQETEKKKEPVKPALLVIDIQNKYLPFMDKDDKEMGMMVINGAIMTFREHKMPVIHVYHTSPKWGPEPGTEPFEFPESVLIKDDDPKVVKNFPSAFQKTELDKILREKGVNTLFLCGLSSVGCVLATYFGGVEREYKTFMIKEGIFSHNAEYTRVIKDITETVSFETMGFMLENLKK